jgi:hypothetical protein
MALPFEPRSRRESSRLTTPRAWNRPEFFVALAAYAKESSGFRLSYFEIEPNVPVSAKNPGMVEFHR